MLVEKYYNKIDDGCVYPTKYLKKDRLNLVEVQFKIKDVLMKNIKL